MNTVDRTARLAALGSAAALTVVLCTGCGTQTAHDPQRERGSLVNVPDDDAARPGGSSCPPAPDVVLRRTDRDAPACESPAPSRGYPGAASQSLG